MADRKLEDNPEDLRTLHDLVAKAVGAPVERTRIGLWERAVRRWKPLVYAPWVGIALGWVFLAWMVWLGRR